MCVNGSELRVPRPSFHFITDSRDAVDEVMHAAVAAGGTVVEEAACHRVGRVLRLLQRPQRHLWKVATAS